MSTPLLVPKEWPLRLVSSNSRGSNTFVLGPKQKYSLRPGIKHVIVASRLYGISMPPVLVPQILLVLANK